MRRVRGDVRERLGCWWLLVWLLLAFLVLAVLLARVPLIQAPLPPGRLERPPAGRAPLPAELIPQEIPLENWARARFFPLRTGYACPLVVLETEGPDMSERILVVDDERPIADILRFNLEQAGYQVAVAYDGPQALEATRREEPDLIVLDIMLPGQDGFSVCRAIRQFSQVPILMLTAKEEEVDTILGLELGADDYVTKPFSPREIVARIKAILRRVQDSDGEADGVLAWGNLELDLDKLEVRKQGQRLELTPREFELLRFLALKPGRVFSREILLEQVWGFDYYGDIRTVDVTVRRLREKLEDDPGQPRFILTRRGAGYYFGGR